MALQRPFERITTGLKVADKAASLLDGVVYPDLQSFPRHENYYLKPRIQDALASAISDALQANEKLPEEWRERVRLLRQARGTLKYFLVLTNSAVSRGHLDPTRAAKWQGGVEEVIRMASKLISYAQGENGNGPPPMPPRRKAERKD